MQLLKEVNLAPDFDMSQLVSRTNGYSGSDLKELCRNAVMIPVRESLRSLGGGTPDLNNVDMEKMRPRPVRLADFFVESAPSAGSTMAMVELD
ncbi:hypothetical protein BDK51DRAFT_44664 [Blyttiomyces helicus]|uniref:AAA ATPase AAA+ lid domain-containing protein n=1 Tax=Blyttiomyces helicus TaxID=388810 RepID=A0A4P9W877_9FUNG|nr:hypothetical protein BDK51DRAFT_44664 [Blyttiomyces helicus]|eukprot:RKO88302.1 hypothetical protein BDK51DRAFT_44664 [Blyttiomyces helicus]